MIRLFVAIDMPNEVKDEVYKLQKEIGNDAAKIKWAHKKNIHLTLKFIGYVEEDKLEDIKKLLNDVSQEDFEVCLDEAGTFPSKTNVRVLWAGLKPEQPVLKLQQKVDEQLINYGKPEQRFQAHITFGRIKFIKSKDILLDRINTLRVKRVCFKVKEFKLMKSTLSKDGPKYETIETYELK